MGNFPDMPHESISGLNNFFWIEKIDIVWRFLLKYFILNPFVWILISEENIFTRDIDTKPNILYQAITWI